MSLPPRLPRPAPCAQIERLLPAQGPIELGELKQLLQARSADAFADAAAGYDAAARWSRRIDALVLAASERAARRAGSPASGFAVVALGGYGRGELNPHSDIDLMLLHDRHPHATVDAFASELFRPLWDVGLDVGHAARDLRACAQMMAEDMKTATALLESRLLWGDAALFERLLDEVVQGYFATQAHGFVERKIAECQARHAAQGDTVFRMRPDIKEAPGALRDLHTLSWTERALEMGGIIDRVQYRQLVSVDDRRTLAAAYAFFLRVRTQMHLLSKRRQDVLDYELQPRVAERLGYRPDGNLTPPELLMRDYYRYAAAVERILRLLFGLYRELRTWPVRSWRRLQRRRIDERFVRIAGQLHLARPDVFERPHAARHMMDAFVLCRQRQLQPSAEIIKRVRDNVWRIDETYRHDPTAAAQFIEILSGAAFVGPVLRQMHASGFLGEYLPEFGEITCLVNYDVYHDFTVDEHTLRAVAVLDEPLDGPEPPAALRGRIWRQLERPWLLRLALLVHDLGKAKSGGGHSERGALMMPQMGKRLHLAPADIRLLAHLLRHHTTLSRLCLRRDYRDPELLRHSAEQIGSLRRLNLLYLLTYCDATSVGRASWPHWHDILLHDLYVRLKECYVQQGNGDEVPSAEEQLLQQQPDARAQEAVRRHFALMSERYGLEVDAEEAGHHMKLVARLEHAPVASDIVPGQGLVDLWIASSDQTGRFAQIAAVLSGHAINIVSARAYTRTDRIILDHFVITPPPGENVARYARIQQDLAAVFAGATEASSLIEQARRRIPTSEGVRLELEPRIIVDNRSSPQYSIIDVICGDRVGLLYALATRVAAEGVDIHYARISTVGGMAVDVFYATDQRTGGKLTDEPRVEALREGLAQTARDVQQARR